MVETLSQLNFWAACARKQARRKKMIQINLTESAYPSSCVPPEYGDDNYNITGTFRVWEAHGITESAHDVKIEWWFRDDQYPEDLDAEYYDWSQIESITDLETGAEIPVAECEIE
jgi:hypothetical protein